ncbi:MAG: TRAP transporter permease, partial [Amphritea sp.]|nr:TRAP transporter permease [Amphritea sp.]
MSTIDTQTDQETAEKLKSLELVQRLDSSPTGRFIYWAGVVFALVHIYFNTLSTVSELWVSAIHFGGFALLCALMVPMVRCKTDAGRRLTLLLDILLGSAAVFCAIYLIGFEDA